MKLQKQWKMTGEWSMLSLGRGYCEFTFAFENDLRIVWAVGTGESETRCFMTV